MLLSASCNRVPVVDGHTECVSVKLRNSENITEDSVKKAFAGFEGIVVRNEVYS